jgi:hypothetical protein
VADVPSGFSLIPPHKSFKLNIWAKIGDPWPLEYTAELILILSHVGMAIDWVLDWMIGFIDTLYALLGTTGNTASAIADLHTLQFIVTHALGFSDVTSRILATDL